MKKADCKTWGVAFDKSEGPHRKAGSCFYRTKTDAGSFLKNEGLQIGCGAD
jgi:hypothetical protein